MQYRRLGRTELRVSSVGMGTNQLRLLPEAHAVDTLLAGFQSGVNFVHVSCDYEGAEKIVAKAISEHDGVIYPAINAYDIHGSSGSPAIGFEQNFESSCEIFDTNYLPLYGVAAMEDREALRENVWDEGGIIELLKRLKREKRIGHTFCTSHGSPNYIRKLVETDVFDAIMVSCNPLGFHLLTLNQSGSRDFEDIVQNSYDILPLCKEKDVGVMVMMPLAGGLLVQEKGFPSTTSSNLRERVSAQTVLKKILQDTNISSVMPGVTSSEEAMLNASAGGEDIELSPKEDRLLTRLVGNIQSTVCSRCGACEPLCSKKLPVSWLFRAAEMAEHPSEYFETWKEVEYFELHPSIESECSSCELISCRCPYDIDIPKGLKSAHSRMLTMMENIKVPPPTGDPRADRGTGAFCAKVQRLDISGSTMSDGHICRIQLENIGQLIWLIDDISLNALVNDRIISEAAPRQIAYPGDRVVISLEVKAADWAPNQNIKLNLTSKENDKNSLVLFEGTINNIIKYHAKSSLYPMIFGLKGRSPKDKPYSMKWVKHNLPESWLEGSRLQIYIKIKNTGTRVWTKKETGDKGSGAVHITTLIDQNRASVAHLPHDVLPEQEAIVGVILFMPEGNGSWDIEISLVEQGITYFSKKGVSPLKATIDRDRWDQSQDQEALATMLRLNPAFHLPSEGIPRSRAGQAFPLVAAQAKGDKLLDHAGNQWIDYAMGWGAALLGHAHPEIKNALSDSIENSSITNLPHVNEAEVSKALCDLIPSAEMVLFGKNGSDVCSAAIRVAMIYTGRRKVLFSGFHGWKDPFAQAFEPALSEMSEQENVQLIRFRNNDLKEYSELLKEHAGDTAAVILEPAAQVEGIDGPVRDVDPKFLAAATKMAKKKGIIVIFDEIFTGFRYRSGSVQAATGVRPNLSCFGKGMSAGMPLSALVGEKKILAPTLSKIFYHPTYKGESYSFAATKAALEIYRRSDVPRSIEAFGIELMQKINLLSEKLGVAGQMTGLPFRMVYKFEEEDPTLLVFKRTLLQQELLLNGVMTFRGFMIPSFAHNQDTIEVTLKAFEKSLRKVIDVANKDDWIPALELPLLR
ncbi:MAG: glutamate-1-semialdehyde 2,1-aminomutase [Candidatus Azotimanducaceae bacterium]|jgi:glutamate-1-semialdehyde 2,1-aminomutase